MSAMGAHFGEHVTIDGYDGDPAKLNDKELIASCLVGLCDMLKMHPLCEPSIVSAPDNQLKDPGGWSGFLIIAESHISLHTFPKRRFISADVYTCQNGIDVDVVIEYFQRAFALQEIETHFIVRGTHYLREARCLEKSSA
jgi:S-adenosylmethionine decarboxylase